MRALSCTCCVLSNIDTLRRTQVIMPRNRCLHSLPAAASSPSPPASSSSSSPSTSTSISLSSASSFPFPSRFETCAVATGACSPPASPASTETTCFAALMAPRVDLLRGLVAATVSRETRCAALAPAAVLSALAVLGRALALPPSVETPLSRTSLTTAGAEAESRGAGLSNFAFARSVTTVSGPPSHGWNSTTWYRCPMR